MKTKKKRTTITIETTRVLVISGGEGRSNWCPRCAAEVNMLTVGEAAALARASPAEISRMLEAQELHYAQTPGSPVLVCPNSLPE